MGSSVALYRKRLANGMCGGCGFRPHRDKVTTCEVCFERKRNWKFNKTMPQRVARNARPPKEQRRIESLRRYRQKHHERLKAKMRVYIKDRKKNDISFKLAVNLRSRMRTAIKNNAKTGSAIRDLGCSVAEFKRYIEEKFQAGMSWENHGEWHLDHVRPLASFDLTDRKQFLQACHFTNMQPLWALDNLKKHVKYAA